MNTSLVSLSLRLLVSTAVLPWLCTPNANGQAPEKAAAAIMGEWIVEPGIEGPTQSMLVTINDAELVIALNQAAPAFWLPLEAAPASPFRWERQSNGVMRFQMRQTYKLDTTSSPWQIDLVTRTADGKSTATKGLMELQGDRLSFAPGGQTRPASLTEAGKVLKLRKAVADNDEVRRALEAGLKITASLSSGEKKWKKREGLMETSRTYMGYNLKVELKNDTPYEITLGHQLVLIQTATNDRQFHGCVVEKGPTDAVSTIADDPEPGRSYMVDNYNSTALGNTLDPAVIEAWMAEPRKQHPAGAGFGSLLPGKTVTISETLHSMEGFAQKDQGLSRVALPVLIVKSATGTQRFIPYLRFGWVRSNPPGSKNKTLPAARLQLITLKLVPQTPQALENWLAAASPTMDQLFAVNWISAVDRAAACEALKKIALSGERYNAVIKIAALRLLARFKSDDIASEMLQQLSDASAEAAWRLACASYLQDCKHQPAALALVQALEKGGSHSFDGNLMIALAAISPEKAKPVLLNLMDRHLKDHKADAPLWYLTRVIRLMEAVKADDEFWTQVMKRAGELPAKDLEYGYCTTAKAVTDIGARPPELRRMMGEWLAKKGVTFTYLMITVLQAYDTSGSSPTSEKEFYKDTGKWMKHWIKFAKDASGTPAK